VVDFFIDHTDRYARMRVAARFSFRKLATADGIAAVDRRPARAGVHFDVAVCRDLGAAPRTARELRRRSTSGVEGFGIANVLNGFVTVGGRAGGHLVADPE